jgi:carbon storage regulator
MLIIRRGCNESVWIGDNIEVEVLDITASQVKLGIRAPKSIPVLRKEILQTLEANRDASHHPSSEVLAGFLWRFRKERNRESKAEPPSLP